MHFCSNYSSALLVIISVEKFIALYFPLKTKIICTVRIAKRVSIVTALIFVLFDAQFFYIGETIRDAYGSYCTYSNVSEAYLAVLAGVILATLYSYGPFTIMIIVNILIIYKFAKAKLRTKQGGTESTDQALSKSAIRGTAMLLTISFTFIILTAPALIANLTYGFGNTPYDVYGVTAALQCMNHGINCILYCLSGTRFRDELKKTICCYKNYAVRTPANNSGTTPEVPICVISSGRMNDTLNLTVLLPQP